MSSKDFLTVIGLEVGGGLALASAPVTGPIGVISGLSLMSAGTAYGIVGGYGHGEIKNKSKKKMKEVV